MKEFVGDVCGYSDSKKPHEFTIDLDNPAGVFDGVGVCKVCGGINKFRYGAGVRSVTKPDYVDPALTNKSVLVSNNLIPSFISSVKPDSDNSPKLVIHEGKKYFVLFEKGAVKNFFSEEQLINDFSLMSFPATDTHFTALTWNDYFQKTYKDAFNSLDITAAGKRIVTSSDDINWLKNNNPVYLKNRIKLLKSSLKNSKYDKVRLDNLINGFSQVDTSGLKKSIDDLKKIESELNGCNDLVNSVSFLFGDDFKNYLLNKTAGVNPDINVPHDFKSRIDNFLETYTVNDSYIIEDTDLNDLKRELTKVLSDKLLDFKIDINDPAKMISDLSVLVEGKNKILTQTKEIVHSKKIGYSANQLVTEHLKSVRDNSDILTTDEIVSKFKSLVGDECSKEAVDNFVNYLNEINDSLGIRNVNGTNELSELVANLNRVNTFRKLNHKVKKSRKAGYELVDLTDYNEVVLLFNKTPTPASVVQAGDNLRTLIARKIGVYPSIDQLNINCPNAGDEVIAFIKNYVNVKNINFTKQSETIDKLISKMYASGDKLTVSDFLSSNRDSLAGLTLDKVLIDHVKSEINQKNASWTKRFIHKVAVKYHNLSSKLGVVKAAAVIAANALLGIRGANAIVAYVDERARLESLNAPYDGALPDPATVDYADMEEQPENIDYWLDAKDKAKDGYDDAIAESKRLTAQRELMLKGSDVDNDGDLDAVDTDNDGDYDIGYDPLIKEADVLDADYKAGFNNGPARAVFDLTDSYERAFMDVDEAGPGTAGLDEEAMFTDSSCPYNINNEYLTKDVTGVGAKGELNPFYDDPESDADNWGEYGRGG
ncbi:MAG TPA: hypothetical protein VI790_04580, partial [Candidatus Nanoarchaeia archaeon]|nr:hypothetical protein [Candidatus Nanoarchaeia archaeon]